MTDKNLAISPFIPIDRDVLLNRELNSTDKIVYAIITVLAINSYKGCYAKNKYICELIGINIRQLQYCLSKLKKFNYITIEIKEYNKRIIKPTINKFIENRENENETIKDFVDYNWLEEE